MGLNSTLKVVGARMKLSRKVNRSCGKIERMAMRGLTDSDKPPRSASSRKGGGWLYLIPSEAVDAHLPANKSSTKYLFLIDKTFGIGIMHLLTTSMTRQELWNEWHLELKIICNMLIAYEDKRMALGVNAQCASNREPDIMNMFHKHFKKVSVKQGSEIDGPLGYEDTLDYAKWYVSGKDIFGN